MIKSELITTLAEKQPNLQKDDVEAAVNCMLALMADALTQGERIEIRGFGCFNLHTRPPRTGRNPKTGESVPVSATVAIHFKPGKEMKDRVNDSRLHCKIEDSTPTDNQQT